MKKVIITLILISALPAFSQTITGEIQKQRRSDINQIYDAATQIPIEGVLIKIPSKNYQTVSDADGSFKLETSINAPTIMSLEKQGYKPHSLTINSDFKNPLSIAIEKSTPNDAVIETDMIHIGDNSYSKNSANASEFTLSSEGSFYSKDFEIQEFSPQKALFLIIGSIIGIDTAQAQKLGQSHVLTAFASPPEIFFNNNKIADVKINGDSQKINIPRALVKFNQLNNITIKAGRNLYKTSAVDYDDIEFTNLLLELK